MINKRIKMSEETKKKISIANKGKHNSQETEFKKGGIPFMKGKHHSKEAKEKLSLAGKGRKYSEEFKQLQKERFRNNPNFGMKNKKHSSITKRKMSLAKVGLQSNMKGKKHSKKTKIKMSAIKQDINIKDWNGFSKEPYNQKWTNKFKREIRKRDN